MDVIGRPTRNASRSLERVRRLLLASNKCCWAVNGFETMPAMAMTKK
jgi:hypothetical protein